MRKLLHFTFLLAIMLNINFGATENFSLQKAKGLNCSLAPVEEEFPLQELRTCPLDSCQKVSIELSLQGLNYAAAFTCYKWTDWGNGLEIDWTDGGRLLFFTFPNHRICQSTYRICVEEPADRTVTGCDCHWQPIESCPKNNTLTVALDACLFGQSTLFLEVFLEDK